MNRRRVCAIDRQLARLEKGGGRARYGSANRFASLPRFTTAPRFESLSFADATVVDQVGNCRMVQFLKQIAPNHPLPLFALATSRRHRQPHTLTRCEIDDLTICCLDESICYALHRAAPSVERHCARSQPAEARANACRRRAKRANISVRMSVRCCVFSPPASLTARRS